MSRKCEQVPDGIIHSAQALSHSLYEAILVHSPLNQDACDPRHLLTPADALTCSLLSQGTQGPSSARQLQQREAQHSAECCMRVAEQDVLVSFALHSAFAFSVCKAE